MHPIPNLSNRGKNERHVLSGHRLVTRPRMSSDFYTLLIGPMYAVPFFLYISLLLSKRGHRTSLYNIYETLVAFEQPALAE